jgi:hypothetical protein
MEAIIIPLLALIVTMFGAVIGATAYIVSRLSSQDSVLKDVREDLIELKVEQKDQRKLADRVAILEFRMSKSGNVQAQKP